MIIGVQPHISICICIYRVGQGGSFSVVMSHIWCYLFAADGRAVHTCSAGMQLPRDAEQPDTSPGDTWGWSPDPVCPCRSSKRGQCQRLSSAVPSGALASSFLVSGGLCDTH